MRLDIYLTKHHDIQSRNKAQELIASKKVKINGRIITKSSFNIDNNDISIEILEDNFYVSRSAYKLKYFLEDIKNLNFSNKIALDIGSSTGGFTQILLEHNVKQVSCLDVGSNQLHPKIKNNDKIVIYENTDIRDFKSDILYDIITCDVSFISIHHILNNINNLANKDIIILFKPQYEVGKDIKRDKNGVVLDTKAIEKVREYFINKCFEYGWKLIKTNISKIKGKNGNIEELFYFQK
jgi:23S rRNA (cytidine1920-2'-O)/16S rRNA (cytidine1409-2'-O)-methyltransferase